MEGNNSRSLRLTTAVTDPEETIHNTGMWVWLVFEDMNKNETSDGRVKNGQRTAKPEKNSKVKTPLEEEILLIRQLTLKQ